MLQIHVRHKKGFMPEAVADRLSNTLYTEVYRLFTVSPDSLVVIFTTAESSQEPAVLIELPKLQPRVPDAMHQIDMKAFQAFTEGGFNIPLGISLLKVSAKSD